MLPTINLNHKLRLKTNKIQNVFSNRLLPFEFMPGKSMRTQLPPQNRFGIGRHRPHTACECLQPHHDNAGAFTNRAVPVNNK